ncbi:MAG: uL15m family ribosomal protein, partial [Hyphomicrobium sp.]
FNEINVGSLQQAIEDKRLDAGKPVDVAVLVAAGILRREKDGVRLLGDGEIKSKITITVNHASAKAKAAVEKAGGSVNVIPVKILEADEIKRAKSVAKKAAKANKKPGAAKQDA